MKKVLLFIIILVIQVGLHAQNEPYIEIDPYTYVYLKLTDSASNPVAMAEIIMKDIKTQGTLSSFTNAKGIASFKCQRNTTYSVKVDEKEISTLEIPVNSSFTITRTLQYNPPKDFANQPIDTVLQQIDQNQRPEQGKIYLKIHVCDRNDRKVTNMPVRVLDPRRKKVYLSKTNQAGAAVFMIHPNSVYQIGIERFDKYAEVKTGEYSMGFIVEYEPTKIEEKIKGDTILQELPSFTKATSMRAIVRIYLIDHDRVPLVNEPVFLDETGTSKVYMAYTDKKGVATLLLPKGSSYLLNFTYERGMKLLEFPAEKDYQTTNIRSYYIGTKKVQEYYHAYARKNEFRTEFLSPGIEPAEFDRSVVEITKDGFVLNFPNTSPLSAPAIHNDELYVSGGYHTPEIYCLNRLNAKSKWGAKLSESGISPAVFADGMILVNTQSCTLYAIDAETGVLAWSKWLGPNIYTTPSVYGGKVFTVYPNQLETYFPDSNYVIVAFDIKTGNIAWQNWLSQDVIASPVAAGNYVYVADQKGKMYKFDINSGQQRAVVSVAALLPPTIYGEKVFTRIRSGGKIVPAILSAENFKIVKLINELADEGDAYLSTKSNAMMQMSFNTGRILVAKNQAFITSEKFLSAYDPESGQIKWKSEKWQQGNINMPVWANNKILITSGQQLISFNPANGSIEKEIPLKSAPYGDIVLHNGWIYYCNGEGKVIAVNLTGKIQGNWEQWSGNQEHNPAF